MSDSVLILPYLNAMNPKRFAISWGISSLVMIILSFIWHGLLLNDFRNITYNFQFFVGLTILVYLLIGFILNVLLNYLKFEDNAFSKRTMIGGAFGFFIYLIVFTLGISYHNRGLEHVLIDFSWQMIEQGTGAVVVSFCLRVFERMDAISETD